MIQLAADPSVVHGGEILANLIAWGATAFGGAIATFVATAAYRLSAKLGVQITTQQRDILQSIVVNGVNDAAAKAQAGLASNAKLDARVTSQIAQDAIAYVQTHAADTLSALGLDPKSGQAVEAIRARIATAVVDKSTPTDPIVTPSVVGVAQ